MSGERDRALGLNADDLFALHERRAELSEELAEIDAKIAAHEAAELESIACTCVAIQAADPLRHFKGCPLRGPLPQEPRP